MSACLEIVQLTPGSQLVITDEPAMPGIIAVARIGDVSPDPTASTIFTWRGEVVYRGGTCLHDRRRTIAGDALSGSGRGGRALFRFPRIRGGTLTITVTACVDGVELQQSVTAQLVGTNPRISDLRAELGTDVLRRIARQESQFRQFNGDADCGEGACPLWSLDNQGGVGLMQITNPRPTDDQVWSWRENARAGRRKYNTALASARRFPNQIRQSNWFRGMVERTNEHRREQGIGPLTITVPDWTAEQITHDAIRGYNGWAGRDASGYHLHEFRLGIGADGLLRLRMIDASRAEAIWERVPAADRPQLVGDPDYVTHVLAQQP